MNSRKQQNIHNFNKRSNSPTWSLGEKRDDFYIRSSYDKELDKLKFGLESTNKLYNYNIKYSNVNPVIGNSRRFDNIDNNTLSPGPKYYSKIS